MSEERERELRRAVDVLARLVYFAPALREATEPFVEAFLEGAVVLQRLAELSVVEARQSPSELRQRRRVKADELVEALVASVNVTTGDLDALRRIAAARRELDEIAAVLLLGTVERIVGESASGS